MKFQDNQYCPERAGAGKHRFLAVVEIETWGADSWDAVSRTRQNIGIGPGTYAEGAMPKFFKPGPNHVDHTLNTTTIRDLRVLGYVGFFPEVEPT